MPEPEIKWKLTACCGNLGVLLMLPNKNNFFPYSDPLNSHLATYFLTVPLLIVVSYSLCKTGFIFVLRYLYHLKHLLDLCSVCFKLYLLATERKENSEWNTIKRNAKECQQLEKHDQWIRMIWFNGISSNEDWANVCANNDLLDGSKQIIVCLINLSPLHPWNHTLEAGNWSNVGL